MKKAMSIALIVEKASADALLRSARNQIDSNAYEVFNTVVELNGRYSSTDASAIGIDRLIIFDSDTTLGTGNLLDTNLQILNMFLGKAEKIESIALVKKTREDRINQYRANVNHPHSLVIPLSDRLEASFLADLLTLSLKDIADTYTDTRITSPTLTSQPISDDRTYSAASAIPGDILSLGAAGSSHADTGFFDDENLTVEDRLAACPPPQLRDFHPLSTHAPQLTPSANPDMPIFRTGARVNAVHLQRCARGCLRPERAHRPLHRPPVRRAPDPRVPGERRRFRSHPFIHEGKLPLPRRRHLLHVQCRKSRQGR